MPRPTRHQGSGRLSVIPDRWSEDHAVVVEKTLDSVVWIGPSQGTRAWNPTTEQTETVPPAPVYEGPASVAMIATAATDVQTVVDDLVSVRRYEITLPYAVTVPSEGHVVKVTADPDPALVGRRLSLDAGQRGTRRFSRVLQTTLID